MPGIKKSNGVVGMNMFPYLRTLVNVLKERQEELNASRTARKSKRTGSYTPMVDKNDNDEGVEDDEDDEEEEEEEEDEEDEEDEEEEDEEDEEEEEEEDEEEEDDDDDDAFEEKEEETDIEWRDKGEIVEIKSASCAEAKNAHTRSGEKGAQEAWRGRAETSARCCRRISHSGVTQTCASLFGYSEFIHIHRELVGAVLYSYSADALFILACPH